MAVGSLLEKVMVVIEWRCLKAVGLFECCLMMEKEGQFEGR
jgi:hypothetical protein